MKLEKNDHKLFDKLLSLLLFYKIASHLKSRSEITTNDHEKITTWFTNIQKTY